MSNFKTIGLIKLSIKDLLLEESQETLEKSVGCYIKINQKVYDIILFNKKEPSLSNLIIKRQDEIEILFKNVKKTGVEYGLISLDLASLYTQGAKTNKTEWFPLAGNNNSFGEKSSNGKALVSIEIEWVDSLRDLKKNEKNSANYMPILADNILNSDNTHDIQNEKPSSMNSKEYESNDIVFGFLEKSLEKMKKIQNQLLALRDDPERQVFVRENFSSLTKMKEHFKTLLKEEFPKAQENNSNIKKELSDLKRQIISLFHELDPNQKPRQKNKENINFDNFLKKMEKEVHLLSKITDGVNKIQSNKEKHAKNKKEQNENLQEEISFLRELNAKLESKVDSLTKQLNNTNNLKPSLENLEASHELKTILTIVSFISNNPGSQTIILQELMNKLKSEVSCQISEKLSEINKKLMPKQESGSPFKQQKFNNNSPFKQPNVNNNCKKLYKTEFKKQKSETSFDCSRVLKEPQINSQDIEKKLIEYQENNNEDQISIQKLNEEGYYKIGNKKVVIQLINGKLVVRIGGGFLQLKDFLEFYSVQEFKKSSQNNKTDRFSNEKTI